MYYCFSHLTACWKHKGEFWKHWCLSSIHSQFDLIDLRRAWVGTIQASPHVRPSLGTMVHTSSAAVGRKCSWCPTLKGRTRAKEERNNINWISSICILMSAPTRTQIWDREGAIKACASHCPRTIENQNQSIHEGCLSLDEHPRRQKSSIILVVSFHMARETTFS